LTAAIKLQSLIENLGPTKTNPLGVNGAGEAGNVGALAAIMNAVVDALSPLGVTHIDMPATPEKVWRAVRAARRVERAIALAPRRVH
jgi:carbon-monoxide dehydrogenase large subunit